MNVLYILGNGFDKAQGMKTSYPEFYQYLMDNTDDGSPLLQKLKKDINSEKKLWSDMEEAFGQFTSKVNTAKELEDLYFELSDNLQKYLLTEEDAFIPSAELEKKFVEDFIYPERYLAETDRIQYNDFVKTLESDFDTSNLDISVMTFNYTDTLEKLLSWDSTKNMALYLDEGCRLKKIVHVHGRLNDSIIIGVDNNQQIANLLFRKEQDVTDFLIKRQSYEAMKYNRHKICEELIYTANLIILYGVSLGNTDAFWWKLIGEQLKERNTLYVIQYIYKPDLILPRRKQLLRRVESIQLNYVMEKFDIDRILFPNITDRLNFITNSNAFKI